MVRGSLLLCAGKPCFVMARYLSRADLSCIAGKYIDQYYARFGISKDDPSPINLEQFASSVLGLNVKMLPLCSDGSILGLTVFQRCGFTVTLGDGTKLVEIFMPKDVVIDSALAAELLMPTFLVNAEIERAALRLPNGILYKSASDPNYEKILEIAARMGVSWSAIRIRLQQMQVINGKPIHCHPLDIIRFGE